MPTAEKWYDGQTLVRTISLTIDAAGQLTQASDPAATYGYNYDNDGRATYESQSLSGLTPLVEYSRVFDAASRMTTLTATIGGTADFKNTHTYDNIGRLTTRKQEQVTGGNAVAAKRADFTYDPRSLVTKVTRYADATGTEFVANSFSAYDDIGRLTKLIHTMDATAPGTGWGTNPLAGYQYTYDGPLGSRRSIRSPTAGVRPGTFYFSSPPIPLSDRGRHSNYSQKSVLFSQNFRPVVPPKRNWI